MKTVFPYPKIDYGKYFDAYMAREDAIRAIPTKAELTELARKSIVKGRIELLPVPRDEAAREGDTLTIRAESELPKFNRPSVTVTLGRGLYDRTLEAALIGLRVGEGCEAEVRDKPVKARVLAIRRRSAPEPTDEMVRELQEKDRTGNPIETVKDFVEFICRQKTDEVLATVNYYVMEQILADHPLEDIDQSDLDALAALERAEFIKLFREQKGIDLTALTPERFREELGVDSLDDFIKMRGEWYRMKVQQCLVILNILDLPCERNTDPLDHYEVLSELLERMYEKIREMMTERSAENG